MKWVKLTLLEAGFLKEMLESPVVMGSDMAEAIELLEKAIEYAEEEEIPEGNIGEEEQRSTVSDT